MKVLIVSNGTGEDLIGSVLAKKLTELNKEIEISAMPLIGKGSFYTKALIKIVGPIRELPSGGFLFSPLDFIKDIFSGSLTHHLKQIKILKEIKKDFDKVICVGDFTCLMIGRHADNFNLYFLPTAKSDYIAKHLKVEKNYMKKIPQKVFPRDELTAKSLKIEGINTYSYGNVMMDAVEISGVSFDIQKNELVIGILPGSRKEAYKNFQMIATFLPALIEEIKKDQKRPKIIISLPSSLAEDKLAAVLRKKNIEAIFSDKFGDILAKSDLLIGMAGTANEQAVGMGKPVFTWIGRGPQTSAKRIADQKKLLGLSLLVLKGSPQAKAQMLWQIYKNNIDTDLYRKNGLERMGASGAAERITQEIVK